jgi:hypothetical protein
MENILFPMKYLNITQPYGVGTHRGTYAIDNAGKDRGSDSFYAPFTGRIKKIWANGHTVWLESTQKVKYADGRVDYCTISVTHDNYVRDLRVGQIIKQGKKFYDEGTAGFATGNHVHIEVARGKFSGTGWHLNRYGYWTINNPHKPERAFLLKGTIVRSRGGLNWKRYTPPKKPTPKRKLVKVVGAGGAYVRDRATTKSPLSGSKYLRNGVTFEYTDIVKGQKISGNDKWYKSKKGNFVWSGNLKKVG